MFSIVFVELISVRSLCQLQECGGPRTYAYTQKSYGRRVVGGFGHCQNYKVTTYHIHYFLTLAVDSFVTGKVEKYK